MPSNRPHSEYLTTAAGRPVGDDRNSLTAGPHGPVLLQDSQLIEKIAHLNRERIPERVTHAKGAGAFGEFIVTHDVSEYTRAALFAQVGKRTPVFARFSNYRGEKGSADTVRDPRGFAVKFYTEEGNWDFAGNNVPVFYIRDPMRLPDLIHSQKREPGSNLASPATQWDFWSQHPESLFGVLLNFSDGGIPRSYRHMDGYSCHAFSWFDANDRRVWVKLRWRSLQGGDWIAPDEARGLAGTSPDYYVQDLFEAIQSGGADFPRWRLEFQTMDEGTADELIAGGFPVFDATRIWPEALHPWRPAGELVLNRNPDNYYAQVEQAAFAPGNLTPGIGLSPDRLLQARVFAYPDAQRHRLGVNYQQLAVNAPKSPVRNYYRDGAMRGDDNGGDAPNYASDHASATANNNATNSANDSADRPGSDAALARFREPSFNSTGDSDRYDPARTAQKAAAVGRELPQEFAAGRDDCGQAGEYFRALDADQQNRLIANIAEHMRDVPLAIRDRQLTLFCRADAALGRRLASTFQPGPAR